MSKPFIPICGGSGVTWQHKGLWSLFAVILQFGFKIAYLDGGLRMKVPATALLFHYFIQIYNHKTQDFKPFQ